MELQKKSRLRNKKEAGKTRLKEVVQKRRINYIKKVI